MVIDLREERWFDYLDYGKPRDERGRPQLKDDTPPDIAEEYRKFLEIRELYL